MAADNRSLRRLLRRPSLRRDRRRNNDWRGRASREVRAASLRCQGPGRARRISVSQEFRVSVCAASEESRTQRSGRFRDRGVAISQYSATAPRSVRGGWRFRGSREGSLRSPARDPRLSYRPLRGRGIDTPRLRNDRSAVASVQGAVAFGPVPNGYDVIRRGLAERLTRALPRPVLMRGPPDRGAADSATVGWKTPRPRGGRLRDCGVDESATAGRQTPRLWGGRVRDRGAVDSAIVGWTSPRPRSGRLRDCGVEDSATAERSIK